MGCLKAYSTRPSTRFTGTEFFKHLSFPKHGVGSCRYPCIDAGREAKAIVDALRRA